MRMIKAIAVPLLVIFSVPVQASGTCSGASGPPKETNPRALQKPLPPLDEVQSGCSRFGTPVVRFVVTEEGKTRKHRYLRGTGCASADKELLGWLKKWSYAPATREGKPVEKAVTVTVSWNQGAEED